MGKLRTGIDNLTKTVARLGKWAPELVDKRSSIRQNYFMAADFCRGGCDVISMYLRSKYKAKNETLEQHFKDVMKDFLDANVAKSVKEIASAHANLVKAKKAAEDWDAEAVAMRKESDDSLESVKSLKASIAKRKKKLLLSKKYKGKLKDYEAALSEIEETLTEQQKMFAKKIINKHTCDPNTYKFTANTTVEDIYDGADTGLTADFAMDVKTDVAEAAKFRGRNFTKQLAVLKDWAGEADEMESESED